MQNICNNNSEKRRNNFLSRLITEKVSSRTGILKSKLTDLADSLDPISTH